MKTTTPINTKATEQALESLAKQLTSFFKSLKRDIADDYRASDDPEDNIPGMQVTIGFTPASKDQDWSWGYQTGDNSYTGGAYGHPYWGVVSLYRRSKSADIATDCVNQIAEQIDWS